MRNVALVVLEVLAWLVMGLGLVFLLFSLTPGTDLMDAPILFETSWFFILPAMATVALARLLRRRSSRR